jgi:hypothetical protein
MNKGFIAINDFLDSLTKICSKVKVMREKQIEQKLVKEIKKFNGLCLKLTCPSFAGMPDRLILLPTGRIGFVEVKRKGEKPRPIQITRHKLLKSLGFKVYVLDDEKQIKEVIRNILGGDA